MKVIIIDPIQAEVREADWDGEMEQVYKWIGTSLLDHFTLYKDNLAVICWVDDIGLLNPKLPRWYCPLLYTQPIAGVGVLIAVKPESEDSDEERRDVPFTADEVQKNIKWGLLFNPHGPGAGGVH